MTVSLESLGIDRLSVADRLELIDRIWDSLPEAPDPPEISEQHRQELARRRAEAESRPGAGRPWRDVLADLEPTA